MMMNYFNDSAQFELYIYSLQKIHVKYIVNRN